VSFNLCADQLLIALADPSQIASLSLFATDRRLSFLAERAGAFPHGAGGAETVVDLTPDLVLAGSFTRASTREALSRLGFRLVALDPVRTIDQAVDQIREVAELVGHPGRGEALIAEIEAARRQARAIEADGGGRPSVAFYQRRGWLTGEATLTSDILAEVGFANAGGRLAGRTGGFVALEDLIAAPPDYLVVSATTRPAEDQGSALLSHPALARLFPPERRIVLPDRLTVCAGPSIPAALQHLAAEARRIAR
jgi:iron complex transport system substrate-binding protein